MNERRLKVGDLVRIDKCYPNTEAAGRLALVVKTLGIETVVEPIGPVTPGTTYFKDDGKTTWWFHHTHLEFLSGHKK